MTYPNAIANPLLDQSPVATLVTRPDGTVLYANPAFARLLGQDCASLPGCAAPDFYDNAAERLFIQEKLRYPGEVTDHEVRARRADNTPVWVSLSVRRFEWQGETAHLATLVEIGERLHAEDHLRKNEEKYRRFAEAATEGLALHRHGKILEANAALAALWGCADPAELAGKNLADLVAPDARPAAVKHLKASAASNFETSGRRQDGATFTLEISTRPCEYQGKTVAVAALRALSPERPPEQAEPAAQGAPTAAAALIAEPAPATPVAQAAPPAQPAPVAQAAQPATAAYAAAPQTSDERLHQILDNVPAATLITRFDGSVVYANPRFGQQFGLAPEKVVDTQAPQLYARPEERQFVLDQLRQHGALTEHELQVKLADGRLAWALLSIRPLKLGEETVLVSSLIDITARKEAEEALRASQEQTRASLERRGRQVQLSTQVAQAIASAADLDDLYTRLVTQVNEQFGYYHTQILRCDHEKGAAVLAKGFGAVGAQRLAAGYQVPLGAGPIGIAAQSGQTVLRPALLDDPAWQPDPLLPYARGEIAVPIKLSEHVLGVLDVQSSQAGALGADDQLLLEGLCGQIATAIETTRLRQEMEGRLHELDTLYRSASHEGWQAFGGMMLPGYRYTHADVLPLDAQWTAAVENAFAQSEPAPEGRALTALPLTVRGGEVIGALGVLDQPGEPLSPDDLNLVEQVSDQVALALDSARLFEQAQKRAAELEAVAQVSTAASTLLEANKLLKAVAELAKELFGLYHAHIYLLEPELERLSLAAGAGAAGQQMLAEGWSIPLEAKRSLVARAARQRRAVIVNDVRADAGFLPNPLLPGTRSEMSIPLLVGDQLLGIYDVQSELTGRFTAVDEQIHTTLAAQVAVALQNANLYAEQSATVARLRELDQLKSAFLANMSHELRTPLNSVLGFAQVILEGLDGPLTDNMESDLKLIEKNGQHLLNLINDVLDMAKIEAGRVSLSLEPVNIRELLEEVLETAGSLARNKDLYLELDSAMATDLVLKIDRFRIHQVILNIIGNAIKFTETGGVRVHVVQVDSKVQLRFCDTGIGIPPDKLESIFEAFSQVDTSTTRKTGGTGLGLPISRRLVELHGGRLWAESQGLGSGGSTFCLELPLEAAPKPAGG